jgi:hypothetical protein
MLAAKQSNIRELIVIVAWIASSCNPRMALGQACALLEMSEIGVRENNYFDPYLLLPSQLHLLLKQVQL